MPEEEKVYTIPFPGLKDETDYVSGMKGELFRKFLESGINIPYGFVITTDAFDDFLVANDLVHSINTTLRSVNPKKFKDIQSASADIDELFRGSVTPPSIYDSIRSAYEKLTNNQSYVSIYPSWIPEAFKHHGGIDDKYIFTNIGNLDDLEKRVYMAWQAIFDPNAIFERIENQYAEALSIGIIVEKMMNAEVSGRAYSQNPLSGDRTEIEIEAVFGLSRGIEELEITPDRYVVSKSKERIVEKSTTSQDSMLVRTGSVKENGPKDMVVEISKPWRLRQKIADSTIQDLAIVIKKVEEIVGTDIEVEWTLETGSLYITNVRKAKTLNSQNIISYGSKLKDIPDGEAEEQVEIEEESEPPKEKSIDEYVSEIEEEIENLNDTAYAPIEINESPKGIAGKIKEEKKVKDVKESDKGEVKFVSDIYEDFEPKNVNIWKDVEYTKKTNVEHNVIEIWLNMQGERLKGTLNSNEIHGLFSVRGEDLVRGFGHNLSDISNDQYEEFVNYAADEIFELASRDLDKYIIYSISDFDREDADKYFSSDKSGIEVHLENDAILQMELNILKKIRNKYGYRRIWLGIRGVSQVQELREIRKFISSSGLHRSSTLKIFLEIDKVPLFLNSVEYVQERIDGVVLYLDQIVEKLLGHKITIEEVLENQVFWEMVAKLSSKIHEQNGSFLVMSENFDKGQDLLFKLMQMGITGACLSPYELSKLRRVISKLELEILKQMK